MAEVLPTNRPAQERKFQIEDAPSGYPRYAALITSHSSFNLCRRFLQLRVRLLLYKQDSLAMLEDELDRIDRQEPRTLFLGNRRRDRNDERKAVMKQIENELAEYDALVKRNRETLSVESAKDRDVLNLKSWLKDEGCIARAETDYLHKEADLMALGTLARDEALYGFQGLIEDAALWLVRKCRGLERLNLRVKVTRNPKVFILSEVLLSVVGRSIMACLLGLLIFTPVAVVECTRHMVSRFFATLFGTILFVLVLSFVTKAKSIEVFVAGATYATVLVVFISGGDNGTFSSDSA